MDEKPTMTAEDLEAEFKKVDEISENKDKSIRVSITGEKYNNYNVPNDTHPTEFIKEEEATLNIDVVHIREEPVLQYTEENPDGKLDFPTTNILSTL